MKRIFSVFVNMSLFAVALAVPFSKLMWLDNSLIISYFYSYFPQVPVSLWVDSFLSGYLFYLSMMPLMAWFEINNKKETGFFKHVFQWLKGTFRKFIPTTRSLWVLFLLGISWHLPWFSPYVTIAEKHLLMVWNLAIDVLNVNAVYAFHALKTFDFYGFGLNIIGMIKQFSLAMVHSVKILLQLAFSVISFIAYNVYSLLIFTLKFTYEALALFAALVYSAALTVFYKDNVSFNRSLFQQPIFYVFMSMFLLAFNSVSLGASAVNHATVWVLISWMGAHFLSSSKPVFSDLSIFELISSALSMSISYLVGMPIVFNYVISFVTPQILHHWVKESELLKVLARPVNKINQEGISEPDVANDPLKSTSLQVNVGVSFVGRLKKGVERLKNASPEVVSRFVNDTFEF